ncbi:TRAP transporter small permease subunit [Sneathiella sp. DP05]|uniref:TRAP transporter small permease protein n=2 Tax=Sneathiella litorea TaxID=2606216 RepID=A0A6L8W6N4_9PROT|nr:TRAP transporter small permease subunit [Sneathiella litorea]
MFLHIILEIILRNSFDTSTFVLDEFVGYAVASLAFLALGETFHKRALIEVTILKDNFSKRNRLFFELFSNLACSVIGSILFYYIGRSVINHFYRGTVSSSVAEVPQFIPEGLLLIGVFVFLLRVFESLWINISLLIVKEY